MIHFDVSCYAGALTVNEDKDDAHQTIRNSSGHLKNDGRRLPTAYVNVEAKTPKTAKPKRGRLT